MEKKVKDYIESQLAKKKQIEEEEKRQLLIREGLYDKVYSPDNTKTSEYPEIDVDSNGKQRYYKKVLAEVTNEEYEIIKKLAKRKQNYREESFTAVIFRILAIVILGIGFFNSIGLFSDNILAGFVLFGQYFLAAMLSFAIAVIIQLLIDIKNKK